MGVLLIFKQTFQSLLKAAVSSLRGFMAEIWGAYEWTFVCFHRKLVSDFYWLNIAKREFFVVKEKARKEEKESESQQENPDKKQIV